MATKKRRLILTLSPKLDQAIDRLAIANGRPRASVVVELLEQLAPQINEVAEAIEIAKNAPERAMEHLFGALSSAYAQAGVAGQELVADFRERRIQRERQDDHD